MTVQPFNDEYFMRRALDEARQAAAEGEVPVGAVVVCGDRVIARAHNQTERLNDPTAHAEMLAITAATATTMMIITSKIGISREKEFVLAYLMG